MKKFLLLLLISTISFGLKAQDYYDYHDYYFTDFNGTLNPDGGSKPYQNNLYDHYSIAATGASQIKMELGAGEVGEYSDDHLYVYDGPDDCSPLIGIYDFYHPAPDIITSTGFRLSIYFITDNISDDVASWQADYYGVKPVPTVYTNTSGTFTDGVIRNP